MQAEHEERLLKERQTQCLKIKLLNFKRAWQKISEGNEDTCWKTAVAILKEEVAKTCEVFK